MGEFEVKASSAEHTNTTARRAAPTRYEVVASAGFMAAEHHMSSETLVSAWPKWSILF